MERKANDIIIYNHEGETIYLKVTPIKDNTCQGCFFYGKCRTYLFDIKDIVGVCDKVHRSDNTSVIFIKINNNKIMKNITLEEARELYKQGGIAKEIALRNFLEEEILNDYTLITSLPKESICKTTELYAKLKTVYKEISKGREINLTKFNLYTPRITFSSNKFKPNSGEFISKVLIDDIEFSIYISTHNSIFEGKLGYENDGVYCGSRLLDNTWVFRERGQAEHFVKFFYKELILLSLADEHKVEFI